ncbi:Nicotinamide N-methyltransferase-like [Ostreococcus tauri]|uniref:Nicotinamide N-methyltransferase-like n=1 Tax=Ostreococcus tauri TaxID=70448 RepID=Q017X8_OSTTA|nr:Nicotinamide N-methyltransferase-like [Ostreococcus tauri]CAL53283.1 Nicotinamide N-methyltransferase-like [Ostreococcus tauri]|eukprot:XP_003079638.1 Nicotinamide N-methyltransferase-like [Ostreococcus tauri]
MVLTERRAFTTPSFPDPPLVLAIEHDAETVPLRTGCRLWSASFALVEHLCRNKHVVEEKRVLELGAGVGACGLACARLGASSVTLTDFDAATLTLAHANALRDGWFDGTKACDVSVRRLDWGDAETYDENGRSYDVVVAADVVYLEEHARELARAVDAHVSASGVFACAFGVRKPELAEAFAEALREHGFLVKTRALDYVSEDMRATAAEHAHDGEITSKGGYRLLEATRADEDEDADLALADFAKDFEDFEIDVSERSARRPRDENEEDRGTTIRVDFSDACACLVDVDSKEIAEGKPSADTVRRAAESLVVHGFVVMQPASESDAQAMVPRDVLEECRRASDTHLNELLSRVEAQGLNPRLDIFRFAEICSRARGGMRYDYTRPDSERVRALETLKCTRAIHSWESLQRFAAPWVEPALAEAYGAERDFAVKSVGCVSSEPGAPEQHFHADGRVFGIFNVFVPMSAVSTIEGPTEFIHGSHQWDHNAAHVTTPDQKAQAAAPRFQPELRVPGSLLVYDYRVMHRGGANASTRRRPLAYVMYGSSGTRDSWNFPLDDSIWED